MTYHPPFSTHWLETKQKPVHLEGHEHRIATASAPPLVCPERTYCCRCLHCVLPQVRNQGINEAAYDGLADISRFASTEQTPLRRCINILMSTQVRTTRRDRDTGKSMRRGSLLSSAPSTCREIPYPATCPEQLELRAPGGRGLQTFRLQPSSPELPAKLKFGATPSSLSNRIHSAGTCGSSHPLHTCSWKCAKNVAHRIATARYDCSPPPSPILI
ncbi:hypothetical protein GGR57DRAFT_59570 [Xylariaceae sp. FL1272]|nr:hypothetical protein GGR57DRAFT_59570 [Xylariaceae sp. FL1272]